MSYHDDDHHDCRRWSTPKLLRELRGVANFANYQIAFPTSATLVTGDVIRERTRVYRDAWLDPILDELEKRLT